MTMATATLFSFVQVSQGTIAGTLMKHHGIDAIVNKRKTMLGDIVQLSVSTSVSFFASHEV